MRRLYVIVAITAAIYPDLARAASAPAALLGRSITINWTENRDQIDLTTSRHENMAVPNTLIVYVGSTGRVFSRMSYAGAQGAASDQTAGSADASGYGTRQVVFSGNSMHVTNAIKDGARQISVTAQPGWSSCSASVAYGRDGSGQALRQTNLQGHIKQLNSISIGGTGCAISDGNALAR